MAVVVIKRAGYSALFTHFFFFLLRSAFIVCIAILLMGCPLEGKEEKSDIARGEEALRMRDIGDATMYFERYLRKNPDGDLRWYAWEQLIEIAISARQDRTLLQDYLSVMLQEYENIPERRQRIQYALAKICDEAHDYQNASLLWEALGNDPGMPESLRPEVYRELARGYMRRLEFSRASDILELCLTLNVSSSAKADCLYDLAEIQILREDLPASEASLRELIALSDVDLERRVLGTFMLADVLEQNGQSEEAITLFESIRETYPNPKVIEMRLAQLKKN